MNIAIVAGPTCAGKTTFIKEHFPRRTVIDLFDFQKDFKFVTPDAVLESYHKCKDEMVAALRRGECIVLEHTLLKAVRRKMYIDAIRSVTDIPIEIYFLMPSDTQLFRQMQERKYAHDIRTAIDMKEIVELPTLDEGYAAVHIISDDPTIARVESLHTKGE